MMLRRFFYSIALLFLTSAISFGQDSLNVSDAADSESKVINYERMFTRANELFESGDFEGAIAGYLELINDRHGNAGVHYNTGNAYYRLRNYPKAILHYEKALAQDSDFEAAQKNLALANSHNVDVFEVLPPSIFDTLTRIFFGTVSANFWAIIALLTAVISVILLFRFYRGGRANSASFSGAMTAVVISLITTGMAWKSDEVQAEESFGIIMSPNVYVKSEPTESSTDALILHEGTKVQIQRNYNDWIEIRLVDGRTGWVPATTTSEI